MKISWTAIAVALAFVASLSSPSWAQSGSVCAQTQRPGTSPRATAIDVASKIGAVGDTVKLRATLKLSDGQAIAGEKVIVRVGTTTVGAPTTNASGVAEIDYKVPNQVAQFPIEARFLASGSCLATHGGATLNAIKSGTQLAFVTPMPLAHEGKFSARFDLQRITDGQGLSGRVVNLFLDGQPIGNVTTEANGRTEISRPATSAMKAGSKIELRFDGDPLYVASTHSVPIMFLETKAKVRVQADSTVLVAGKPETIRGMVRTLDLMSKPAGGVKVWAYNNVRDRNFPGNAISDANGHFMLPIMIDPDGDSWQGLTAQRTVSIKAYAGDTSYQIENYSIGDITIAPAPTTLSVMSSTTAAIVGQNVSVTVRLTRTADGKAIRGARITGEGVATSAVTDANGSAVLNLLVPGGSPVGLRKFSLTSEGGVVYKSATGLLTLDIKPNPN